VPDVPVTVRPLEADEMPLFLDFDSPASGPAFGPPGRGFLDTAAQGHYRPAWTWVAARDDRLLARAAFWGGPDDDHPLTVDWFDVAADTPDRVAAGMALLRAALETLTPPGGDRPEYHLFLPPAWRDTPGVRAPAEDRMAAARGAGLRPFVERLRVEWRRSTPAGADGFLDPGEATASGRLLLRPVGSDADLLAVLERIADGTLDAYTRRDVARDGVAAAAQAQLDGMNWMPAPRDWWRLAVTPGGDVAGVVMPSRNYESAVLGYVGVVPEHRGHGFAAELAAWATAFLAAQGADRVVADTDTGNAPMAAAFTRAGYRVIGHRIVMA
jgi:RimJ/RimL family protein N-acetyltransferase